MGNRPLLTAVKGLRPRFERAGRAFWGMGLPFLVMVLGASPLAYSETAEITMVSPAWTFDTEGALEDGAYLPTCEELLDKKYLKVDNWRISSDGHHSEGSGIPRGSGPRVRREQREKILQRWSGQRGYNEKQIEYLRDVDDSLDPFRTTTITFESEGGSFAGVRVVEGSVVPRFMGAPFEDIGPTTAKFSFEDDILKTSNYVLPEREQERDMGKAAQLLSIGLLNIDRGYEKGVDTIFRIIAQLIIDRNYNVFKYTNLMSTEVIEYFTPVIYSVARETHLSIYKEKGFAVVIDPKTNAAVRTHDGLYLLRFDGQDFMLRYMQQPFAPQMRSAGDQWDYEAARKVAQERREYFEGLRDQKRIFRNQEEVEAAWIELSLLHLSLEKMPHLVSPDNPMGALLRALGQQQRIEDEIKVKMYRKFFEELYILVDSYVAYQPGVIKNADYPGVHLRSVEMLLMTLPNYKTAYDLYLKMAEQEMIFPPLSQERIAELLRRHSR